MGDDGAADLSAVRAVAAAIGQALNGPKIVVSKSTVPVETGDMISSIIAENSVEPHRVDVVSNPEFLREGSAVSDFMQPDRIVIGTNSPEAEALMRDLYARSTRRFVVTDVRTSEMIKYAANAFLATKISFMNEIANICDLVDVDVKAVGRGIGFDHRIGTQFMNPGIGFGGSCFPKDVRALEMIAAGRQLRSGAAARRRKHQPPPDRPDRSSKSSPRWAARVAGKTVGRAGAGVQTQHRRHPRGAGHPLIERLAGGGRVGFARTIRSRSPAVRAKLRRTDHRTATRCTKRCTKPTRCCWRRSGTNTRTSTS